MKPTHKVINKECSTPWNVGAEIVIVKSFGIFPNGDAYFTDTTGTVCIGANLSEVQKINK